MKVMHVTYDMRIGGTEMVIKNIIEGNTNANIDMSIYCIEAPLGPWGEELAESGISVTTQERKPGFDISLIKAIRQHIKENNIDILHCHQYTPWVYGALAAAFTKTKVIFTEHGRFYPDSTNWKRRLVNPVLSFFTKNITAIAKATGEALTTFEYIPSSKIEVVYNGIGPLIVNQTDSQSLKMKLGWHEQTVVIGTIARMDPIKNQVLLLRAFADLISRYPHLRLLIVGDGEERNLLESTVDQLRIREHIIFTGYVSEPKTHLDIMDIFVLPSFSEGTSMTLLEALSLGKPCVVTAVGGNPEVIEDGVTGFVVANNDLNALVESISILVENPLIYSELSDNAIEHFTRRFHERIMCEQYRKIYLDSQTNKV